jgi:ABC-type multidrug transport system fused ATPase/permease subunit
VVVLDEATSSLDSASEAKIQLTLANLLEGRTSFVLRIASARLCAPI